MVKPYYHQENNRQCNAGFYKGSRVPKSRKRTAGITNQQRTIKENRYKDNAIIKKSTDKTYAEMLTKIKREVDIIKTG